MDELAEAIFIMTLVLGVVVIAFCMIFHQGTAGTGDGQYFSALTIFWGSGVSYEKSFIYGLSKSYMVFAVGFGLSFLAKLPNFSGIVTLSCLGFWGFFRGAWEGWYWLNQGDVQPFSWGFVKESTLFIVTILFGSAVLSYLFLVLTEGREKKRKQREATPVKKIITRKDVKEAFDHYHGLTASRGVNGGRATVAHQEKPQGKEIELLTPVESDEERKERLRLEKEQIEAKERDKKRLQAEEEKATTQMFSELAKELDE